MKGGGLAGLLLLGKKSKGGDSDEGGIEREYFRKAFDSLKAGNSDAFARFMAKGVEACVDKAQEGEYDEEED